jgi:hypothetical protein
MGGDPRTDRQVEAGKKVDLEGTLRLGRGKINLWNRLEAAAICIV